jgi:hypothetical protein
MEFCKKIYTDKQRILGKIFMEAKRTVISQNSANDNLYGPAVLWTLFGDPALTIKYPGGQTDISNKPEKNNPDKTPVFPIKDKFIKMPEAGTITIYSVKGAALVRDLHVYSRMLIRLKNGIYFIHFKNQVGKETKQKVIISR